MVGWVLIVPVVAAIAVCFLLSIYLTQRFCCHIRKKPLQTTPPPEITLQNGIARLHHSPLQPHQININGGSTNNNKRRTNYYVFRRGLSSKPLFSWADNPSLVTDAVENGWSRFAFTTYTSSPSVRSTSRSILGPCAGDAGNDHVNEVQISWEVCQGSADFMQKIRLNSGLKKVITSMGSAASVIKSALPLPGPPLGNSSSFPQEAYFEITILTDDDDDEDDIGDLGDKVKSNRRRIEGEKIKLIQESPNEKAKSESLVHTITNGNGHHNLVDELIRHHDGSVKDQHSIINDGKVLKEVVTLSVGLSGGGSLPLKLPGCYPGSIGFSSDGSVFLDGIKLVLESEKGEWGRGVEKVIGCGYNPMQKRVFFTVDSELVHEIYCKTEEFGTPLYPTLAANSDIMVLVNFGQCMFKYAPANLQRTPNPCFIGPLGNSPALGYEDSKELFSMGRIDSQWLNRSTTTRRGFMLHNASSNHKSGGGLDYDEVSEGDLFEIMLDSSHSTGRSPNTNTLITN